MAKVKTLRALFHRRKAGKPGCLPGIFSKLLVLILLSISLGVVVKVQDAGAAATYLAWKKGSFTKTTSGAPASQAINDVGFQPKAVIFYWTQQTATGAAANVRVGYGFATGSSNERAIAAASDDNIADSNTGRRQSQSNCIIILSSGTPALAAQAELTSFDSGGFTLNWTTNDSSAYIIHYIARGVGPYQRCSQQLHPDHRLREPVGDRLGVSTRFPHVFVH
jgi:hypothetical protein